MRGGGRIHRQGQVGVEFAEEEPAASVAVDQAGVLADPAESGIARECALEHWRGIHEHPVAEFAHRGADAVGEGLQPLPHQLVVIAAERVAGDVGAVAVGQGLPGAGVVACAVVHPHRHHADGARLKFGGTRPLVAVPRHVLHAAVLALRQPVAQVCLVLGQVHAGDAGLLETELGAPALDVVGEGAQIRHPASIVRR